jgi:hypothetical protein
LFAPPRHKTPEPMKLTHKVLLYATLAGVLALVFAMYTRPDFVMNLANQVWGCF